MTRAALYSRVSSREQGRSGLSLAAQKQALYDVVGQRDGWHASAFKTEVISTRKAHRPELALLLDALDAGEHDVLVVTRIDRFCRSLAEFALTLERAAAHGWQLVMLDPGVDTTTAYGEAMAGMAAVWAQLERALISQRTKDGLEIARARGTFRPGELQRYDDRAVITRMRGWRTTGVSYGEIGRRLDREGVTPPPRPYRTPDGELVWITGESWHPRTISRILARGRT